MQTERGNMAIQEKHVELISPRAKWNDEARCFTPWLAKNLDLLAEELCLELELVQTEKAVGPFYLDILAKEGENKVIVAIENHWKTRCSWMRENLIKFKDFFDNRLEEFLTAPVPGDEERE